MIMDNSEKILTSYIEYCNGNRQEDPTDFLRFAKFINWTAEQGYYLTNIDKITLHSDLVRRTKIIFTEKIKIILL